MKKESDAPKHPPFQPHTGTPKVAGRANEKRHPGGIAGEIQVLMFTTTRPLTGAINDCKSSDDMLSLLSYGTIEGERRWRTL